MKTEQILEDAEMAATFLRTLISKGVPSQAAIIITSAYISSTISAREATRPPQEPWEKKE